ncbi:hypothetical protein H8F21_13860 [Pseudomonas sp. P66]|uniref:Uncharacterized protein n=1 Tax=Pseudomonas arcuscaelestis TaxID=2710591 RepID=A0ABS2BYE9_9PSED|nr:hypothetical protein [Pseudomonas arcuscaelestis]MBM5458651.1 hypothetical protein [Pseudomonas arcuscaelestis]
MLDYFRKNHSAMMSRQKAWYQLLIGMLLFQTIYVLTNIPLAFTAAFVCAYMLGFLPWTFRFAAGSMIERLVSNRWYVHSIRLGAVVGAFAAVMFPGEGWQRILMFVCLAWMTHPNRRCHTSEKMTSAATSE